MIKNVKHIGEYVNLTNGKVYDVIKYLPLTRFIPRILIKNDLGEQKWYRYYTIGINSRFIDVTSEYKRNKTIDSILL